MNHLLNEDAPALLGTRDGWTRRQFVAASLATGFAAAVQPVSAQTMIKTDTEGLIAGEVQIPGRGASFPAYRAMPASGTRPPVILVVQEIFGVHEHIRDVVRRFAKAGYLAVAPELFYRQGDVSKLEDIKEIIASVVSKVPDAQVMEDLDATVSWADRNGGDVGKLGITGFCWGGRITWLYAAHNPKIDAGVAWYGRLEGAKSEMNPAHPIDLVRKIDAPVLGLYGSADTGIPVESVQRMNEALTKAGKQSTIHVYPGAPHAFHADYRPSYRREAAEDGWKRALEWFRTHGVA